MCADNIGYIGVCLLVIVCESIKFTFLCRLRVVEICGFILTHYCTFFVVIYRVDQKRRPSFCNQFINQSINQGHQFGTSIHGQRLQLASATTLADYVQPPLSLVLYRGQEHGSVSDHSPSPAHESGTVCRLHCRP